MDAMFAVIEDIIGKYCTSLTSHETRDMKFVTQQGLEWHLEYRPLRAFSIQSELAQNLTDSGVPAESADPQNDGNNIFHNLST